MKMIRLSLLAVVAGLGSCASSLNVQTDYDRQANFRQYDSFSVLPDPKYNNDPVLGSELNRRRIADAVRAQLQAKGYQAAGNGADLTVSFETDTRDRQEIQSNNTFTPYWWYNGPRQNTYTRNVEEDRIIVNVRDARANRMIWQGFTSGQILTARTKDPEKSLYNAIAAVMKAFPARDGARGETTR